jgi:teichuronic acid biosynthesis protein TuaE
MATDAPVRPPARLAGLGRLPPPAMVALAVGVAAAGALAVWQPLAGLGLALIAALVAVIARIPMPRLGAALVVLCAVAAVAGPNLAPPPAPWLFAFRILIVVLGVGLLAYLLMDGRLVVPAGASRPAALIGVWVVWSALSVVWADDTVAALRWTLFLTMMGGLAIGIAVLCREPRRARMLLWALGGAFVAACLVALGEIATGVHLPTSRGVQRQGLFGATSFFGNENNFAIYLTLTLPYLAVIPLFVRDVRQKALGYAASILALLMILTTGSKSALISVGLILITLLLIIGRDRQSRGRLAAAAAIAGLTVALLVPATMGSGPLALSQRAVTKLDFRVLAEQIESKTGSGGVRASLLSEGLDLVEQTNGLGVGAGNAETSVKSLKDFPGAANLHNWWLEVLVNGGLIGFAIYLAFFFGLLSKQARAARGSPDPFVRYLALAGTLSMVGFIAGSLGPSTAIHFAPMWITFGLGMGAIVLARRAQREASA